MRDYVGTYYSAELDATYEVELETGSLLLNTPDGQSAPLRPVTPGVFAGSLVTMEFTRDAQSRVIGFSVDAGRVRGLRFERAR